MPRPEQVRGHRRGVHASTYATIVDLRSNHLGRLPDWLTLMPSPEKLDPRWNGVDPSLPLISELERLGCFVLT